MAWAELHSRLQTLLPLFDAPFADDSLLPQAVPRAYDFLAQASHLCQSGNAPSEADRRALLRAVLGAGERLVALNRALQQQWPAPEASTNAAGGSVTFKFEAQLGAAFTLASSCAELALHFGAEVWQVLEFSRCVALLLDSGLLALRGFMAGPTSHDASFEEVKLIFVDDGCRFLFELGKLVSARGGPSVLHTFAAELAPPAHLVAWLETATDVVRRTSTNTAITSGRSKSMGAFMAAVSHVYTLNVYAAHRTALDRNMQLQDSLLQLILPQYRTAAIGMQLPPDRRPDGCTWQQVRSLAAILASRGLLSVLQRQFAATGQASTLAVLRSAVQLLLLVPTEPPANQPPGLHVQLLCFLSQATAVLCGALPPQVMASPGQLKQAAHILLPTVPRWAPLLRSATAGAQATVSEGLGTWPQVGGICDSWDNIAVLLGHAANPEQSSSPVGTMQDLVDWTTAAAAALSALPAAAEVARLLPQRAQHMAPDMLAVPAGMAKSSIQMAQCVAAIAVAAAKQRLLDGGSSSGGGGSSSREPAGSLAAAHAAVWQLHTAGCRLLHWVLGGGGRELRCLQDTSRLIALISNPLYLAADLQRSKAPLAAKADIPDRTMLAICAAHWQAMQAVAAKETPDRLCRDPLVAPAIAASLALVCESGPAAVALAPQLQELLSQSVKLLPQDAWLIARTVQEVLKAGERSARVAAVVLSTGVLESVLERLATSLPDQPLTGLTNRMLNVISQELWKAAKEQLGQHGESNSRRGGSCSSVGSSVGSGASGRQAAGSAQVDEAGTEAGMVSACRQKLAALEAAASALAAEEVTVQRRLRYMQQKLLPAARQLSTALLDWWRWKAQEAAAEQQLELAQAVAARSCAYLRCANLDGEGGPAAGKGVGSQRCSACRVAWYCGTACSHADWRAGHKRVCKALAATRQQQQQQQ